MVFNNKGLCHAYFHGFDDVAHITRWVPKRVHGLGLADAIGGLHFQFVSAGLLRFKGNGPLAEGVFAEIFAKLRLAPVFAAVFGEENFGDAVAAVECNAANGDVATSGKFIAVSEARDE